jgi:1-deoxyxylulose-5-phosphate synthase
VELAITFWETANIYQERSSEEFVGRAIKTYARREERGSHGGLREDA